jgi:peptide/nickel transport system permease protein
VTLIFLNLGFTVSGAITVETVFSWPGLGLLSYEALRGPDVALAAGHLPSLLHRRRAREPGG